MLESRLGVYIDFVQRRWLLLIMLPVLAAVATLMLTSRGRGSYEATATVLISPAIAPTAAERSDDGTIARLTNTYAQLVTRPVVLDEVRARLLLPPATTNDSIARQLSVRAVAGTLLLRVTATEARADAAAALANTTATVFSENSAVELFQTATGTVVVPATVPTATADPDWRTNVVLGVLTGFGLALVVTLALEWLQRPSKRVFEGWPPVAPSPSFVTPAAAPTQSFLDEISRPAAEGFFGPRETSRQTAPFPAAEVAPQAPALSGHGHPVGTTTLPALSYSNGHAPVPHERPLRDEDLRPHLLPAHGIVPRIAPAADEYRPSGVARAGAPADACDAPGSLGSNGSPGLLTGESQAHLSETMLELMGRLDETVDMIRALRPSNKHSDSARV